MGHGDGTVVELEKKKKSKREKGEYMRRISCSSRSALNLKISAADHEVKRAEIELAKTQDDGPSLEIKEKKKKRERRRDIEELVVPQAEDTPGQPSTFLASSAREKLKYMSL